MRLPPRALLAILPLLATGCATTLSTLQTAQPLDKGQYRVTLGTGFYAPLGTFFETVDAAIDQGGRIKDQVESDQPVHLTEEDQQRLLGAGVALLSAPPGANQEITIRAGLLENLDAGLRYDFTSFRLDAKYRVLHRDDGAESALSRGNFDVALGLAGARHTFKGLAFDALEVVQLDDFSRWTVEAPVYVSWNVGEVFAAYTAPKYVFSRTSFDQKLVNYAEQGKDVSGFDARLPSSVDSHFVGATVGLSLGYRYVHLFAELTAGNTWSKAQVFGAERDLGGVTLYPAIGLAFQNSPARPASP